MAGFKFRPLTDMWILARSRTKYYGAFPGGFLERARALLGVNINDPVLHVFGGKVRDYPYKRFAIGPKDKTLDADPKTNPDYCYDFLGEPFDRVKNVWRGTEWNIKDHWAGVIADPPYTEEDALKYDPNLGIPGTRTPLPSPNAILRRALEIVRPGGRVGILHYILPQPPKDVRFVAAVGVLVGYNNRIRIYSVFEKPA